MGKFIAIDLEGTLTTGGVWKGINLFLQKHHYHWRHLSYYIPNYFWDRYTHAGFGDRDKFKVHLVNTMPNMFKGFDTDLLDEMGSWIVENELWLKRRCDILDVVKELTFLDPQISIVLVSGTYENILSAFGRKINDQVRILGTQLEIVNGKSTGRILGQPNQGSVKVSRLRDLLKGSELLSAYSDGFADVPMLELSKAPVAVYPDSKLQKIAIERKWHILPKGIELDLHLADNKSGFHEFRSSAMTHNHIVIVHGAYGSPEEAWFPWLASQLREMGFTVSVPTMPTPEGQNLENWIKAFDEQVKDLDKDSILVGHSIGATFILRKVATLTKPIKACFLVSGFMHLLGIEKFDQINKTFVEKDVDWNLIRSKCENFFMYNSDNDPYVPLKYGEEVAHNLHAKLNIVHKGGHISKSAGYLEFPQLLEDIKEILPVLSN